MEQPKIGRNTKTPEQQQLAQVMADIEEASAAFKQMNARLLKAEKRLDKIDAEIARRTKF